MPTEETDIIIQSAQTVAGRHVKIKEGGVRFEGEMSGGHIAGRDQHFYGLTAEEVTELFLKLKQADQPAPKPPLSYEPETVLIPAGPFLMGDGDMPHAAPQTAVELSTYAIGLYPITNEQFAEFILQTGRLASSDLLWAGNRPPRDRLHHPVIGITWLEALAYCQWLADLTERPYTLPNEAQWEKAARGVDGRLYPWGNEWEDGRCNADLEAITVVDAFPPQSPYGCYDMVGNGREWTTTLWGDNPREPDALYQYPWQADGRRDSLNAPTTTRRIFRGGRGDELTAYRCSRRGTLLPDQSGPRRNRHGFRVVLLGQ
jgi:formylglycine-generating enzyme required for sulfatase activity